MTTQTPGNTRRRRWLLAAGGAAGTTGTTGSTGGTSGRHAAGDPVSGQQEVVHETHHETVYETDPNNPDPNPPTTTDGGSHPVR